jgi:hypothetical protein
MGLLVNFTKYLRKVLYHSLQSFPKDRAEGVFLNSLYEASIILILKLDNDTTRKENCRSISIKNIDAKILNKMVASQIQRCVKKNYTSQPIEIYHRYERLVQQSKHPFAGGVAQVVE